VTFPIAIGTFSQLNYGPTEIILQIANIDRRSPRHHRPPLAPVGSDQILNVRSAFLTFYLFLSSCCLGPRGVFLSI
jgi:hypothetical protein